MTPSEFRAALSDVSLIASRDLEALWLMVFEADNAAEALHDVLPSLIERYGLAAATLAADFYDDFRLAGGVAGAFAAQPAYVAETGAHALIGWAAGEAADPQSFLTLVDGGTQRRIANFGRQTVMQSSLADPKARGWQRMGVGANCHFCDMLISRGAVYSEKTADFGAHDHCNCIAVPAFEGVPRPVRPYKPSARNVSDADRAATRAWIAEHL